MIRVFFLVLILFGQLSAKAIDGQPCNNFAATGLDLSVYEKFLGNLNYALEKRNPAELAPLMRFPIYAQIRNKRTKIRNADEFVKYFNEVFSESFLIRIKKSTPADTVCRDQGVGIANGSLWIQAADFHKDPTVLKVITINN